MDAGEKTDEELLAGFVEGDPDAFTALVHRHRDRVFAICVRYFRNPTDAQDATQETFLAVHRGASSFAGGARFTTWLYRVATNVCNDITRKRVRRPQNSGIDPEWVGQAADDDIGTLELSLDLTHALADLSDAHRQAVLLHSYYGYTYVEIADRLEVPVGTIKARVHRGLAKLADRSQMQPTDDGVHPSSRPPEPDDGGPRRR